VGAATAAVLLAGSAYGVWSWPADERERGDPGATSTSGTPQEAGAPDQLTDVGESGVRPRPNSIPAADGSSDAPWALGTTRRLGDGSCWIASVDHVQGRQATLTLSCDQAGTSEYGNPTPSEWLTIYAVGEDGTSARSTPTDAGPQDTFWTQGNLTDATEVVTTVTLPDVGPLVAVSVEHTNDYGWSWAAG
jgi:hypothetical protein